MSDSFDIALLDNLNLRTTNFNESSVDLVLTENWQAMALFRYLVQLKPTILEKLEIEKYNRTEILNFIGSLLVIKSVELGIDSNTLKTLSGNYAKEFTFLKLVGREV